MAMNLLLLETDQRIIGLGNPRYIREWGNLQLYTFSYGKKMEDDDLPWTKLYVGVNQSLDLLGIQREGVNLLGFEFNSGDYAYWRDGPRFVHDLRWVRDRKGVDLSRVSPLGNLHFEGVPPGSSARLEQEAYGLILEKILEAQRR